MTYQNLNEAYGETLVQLGKEKPNIVVCDADLSKTTKSRLFREVFPDRFFEMGIAEQNMASFAAGLALTGKIAFINSFAVFATGRTYDQLRQSICIAGLNVKVIGTSCGLSDFFDGATHQSIEDVAIMRALPNMSVFAPVDGTETKQVIREITEMNGPCYVRLNRNDMPDLVRGDSSFQIGVPLTIREGKDAVIFATGFMVSKALSVAERLKDEGISVRVVNVSTLKPLDEEVILSLVNGRTGVVTAEEHTLIGGLASVIAYAMRGTGIPLEAVGIPDKFGQSSQDYEELLSAYGLTEDKIETAVLKVMGKK